PSVAEYYPLAVGNRWTYQANLLGERRVRQVEIVKQEGNYFIDNQGGELTVDALGIRDRKRYLIREPLVIGSSWTNVVSVSSVEYYGVRDVGCCDAPAGHFDDCVRVEGRNRVDDRTTLVNELTLAAGTGIVRVEVVAEVEGKRVPQTQLLSTRFEA